MHDEELHNL